MELDHKTFDLAAALSGRSFPEDSFDVWFDEGLAYDLAKVNFEIDKAVRAKQDETELLLQAQEIRDKLDESKYVFTLRGITNAVKRAILFSVSEKHNVKPGKPLTEEAFLDYRANEIAAYVVNITAPSGETFRLSPDEARLLVDQAPDYVLGQILNSIESLEKGAKSGYELAASDVDFLSKPSQEAEA